MAILSLSNSSVSSIPSIVIPSLPIPGSHACGYVVTATEQLASTISSAPLVAPTTWTEEDYLLAEGQYVFEEEAGQAGEGGEVERAWYESKYAAGRKARKAAMMEKRQFATYTTVTVTVTGGQPTPNGDGTVTVTQTVNVNPNPTTSTVYVNGPPNSVQTVTTTIVVSAANGLKISTLAIWGTTFLLAASMFLG